MMQRSDVVKQLKHYIAETILDGEDTGLDESTPLLAWGVINSLELVGLLSFIQQQFQIEIPAEKVTADNLTNLVALAALVMDQATGVKS